VQALIGSILDGDGGFEDWPCERISLRDYTPADYNPRTISDDGLKRLAKSLKGNGQLDTITVNRRSGNLVSGHQRVMVLLAAGVTEAWARVVDMGDAEEKAANIAANNRSAQGEFDDELLAPLLVELRDLDVELEDFSIDLTGFSEQEAEEKIDEAGLSAKPPPQSDEDDIPETEEDTPIVSRTGDLWTLGDHRVLCGDSTKAEDVQRLGAGGSEVVTDPPYGIGYEYSAHDDSSNAKNATLVDAVLSLCGDSVVWTPGLMNLSRELTKHPDAKVACWHKGFAQAGNGIGGASTWEPILIVNARRKKLVNDYLHFGTDREPGLRDDHPCPKPVNLWECLIASLTDGDVYDPFLGSGTTLIACEKLNRRCFGMEIDPRYCDVIVRRWEKYTGREATLETDGKTFREIEAERA